MSADIKRCVCGRCAAHDRGARGPFTPSELLAQVVNAPAAVEMPAELAALSVDVDQALEEYEAAQQGWQRILLERQRAVEEHRQERVNVLHGATAQVVTGDGLVEVASDQDVAAAQEEVERAGERLSRVRAAYHDAAHRLTEQRVAAAYAEDQERLTAERQARREAALRRQERRGLRRIAAMVTRG